MAGRVSLIEMNPLSLSEIRNIEELPFSFNMLSAKKRSENFVISIEMLYKYLVKGFYPELYDNENLEIDSFYFDYLNTYIHS